MKSFLLILALLLLLSLQLATSPTVVWANPLPAPPSQQELDALREMGRQNELKYGSGVTSRSTTVVSPAPVKVKAIPIPTPTTTNTRSGEAMQSTVNQILAETFAGKIGLFMDLLTGLSKQAVAPVTVPTPQPPATSDTAATYWRKGFNIWVQKKDYKTAAEYYKKSLALDPNYVPALASYGYILGAFENKFSEGEAMIKKAMALDPTWSYAPYNLGLLYDISGRRDEGIYWLQYTVDHFPNDPDIEWFKSHLKVAKEWKY